MREGVIKSGFRYKVKKSSVVFLQRPLTVLGLFSLASILLFRNPGTASMKKNK